MTALRASRIGRQISITDALLVVSCLLSFLASGTAAPAGAIPYISQQVAQAGSNYGRVAYSYDVSGNLSPVHASIDEGTDHPGRRPVTASQESSDVFRNFGVAAKGGDDLLGALAASGVKHNPENIAGIARDASGRVVFLETGNSSAGLTHILERHASDFARAGIPESDISDLVLSAATRGNIVGKQGTRPIYEVLFRGQPTRVAVTVGDNGFIVGANPVG